MSDTERKEFDWAKALANFDAVMELGHFLLSIRVQAREDRLIAHYGVWMDYNEGDK